MMAATTPAAKRTAPKAGPTPPRKRTVRAVPKPKPKELPQSRWARIQAEGREGYEPLEPYPFDGTDPVTYIAPPDTVEQVTALAILLDPNAAVKERDMRALFEVVCGDSFPAVWEVIRKEPATVLWPLFADINDWFGALPEEAETLPGG